MTLLAVNLETKRIDTSTRRFIGFSLLVHVILFLGLLLYQRTAPGTMAVTEITWLEPASVPKAAPAPAKTEAKPQNVKGFEAEKRFERKEVEAETSPQPQTAVIGDRLRERLTAMQSVDTSRQLQAASVAPETSTWTRALPAAPARKPSTGPALELKRESAGAPIELKRSATNRNLPRLATAALPDRTAAPVEAVDEKRELARRSLAGNTLEGPVADRPLESYELPRYPDWAKRDGVEASVSLTFFVLPDGSVKENILIQKTSGFEDFNREARRALLTWRFEALSRDAGEQWGTITFHFRLKDLP